MIGKALSTLSLGGLLLITPTERMSKPAISKIEQNTRTVPWATVTRVTIGQRSSRRIRVTGPWMDYVTSVNASGGVSGRNVSTSADKQVEMILDASATATRGDKSITIKVSCPAWGTIWPADCVNGTVTLPVKVFETGPINDIVPSGATSSAQVTVMPNTEYTFNLTGEALGVAKLLPRLLKLTNASIVSRTTTTMRVKGTTPACGFVDVALSDEFSGSDDFPYRHGDNVTDILAGHLCSGSLGPRPISSALCPAGQTFVYATQKCQF